MRPVFRKLMNQSLTITPQSSVNSYGEPVAGVAFSVPARVEYSVKRIVNPQGIEVVSTAQAFVSGDVAVSINDSLTLPESGKLIDLQKIEYAIDNDGTTHHLVLYV